MQRWPRCGWIPSSPLLIIYKVQAQAIRFIRKCLGNCCGKVNWRKCDARQTVFTNCPLPIISMTFFCSVFSVVSAAFVDSLESFDFVWLILSVSILSDDMIWLCISAVVNYRKKKARKKREMLRWQDNEPKAKSHTEQMTFAEILDITYV